MSLSTGVAFEVAPVLSCFRPRRWFRWGGFPVLPGPASILLRFLADETPRSFRGPRFARAGNQRGATSRARLAPGDSESGAGTDEAEVFTGVVGGGAEGEVSLPPARWLP